MYVYLVDFNLKGLLFVGCHIKEYFARKDYFPGSIVEVFCIGKGRIFIQGDYGAIGQGIDQYCSGRGQYDFMVLPEESEIIDRKAADEEQGNPGGDPERMIALAWFKC